MSDAFHQLVAKMRARAHREPGPGVTFSAYELIERAKPTHEGIGSLMVDVRYTLFEDGVSEGASEFAADYCAFASEWVKFYKQISSSEEVPNAAESIDEFDRRYRHALLAYQQLGFKPTRQPSPSYRAELNAVASRTVMRPIPVGRMLAVGGSALAIFLYFRQKKAGLLELDLQPEIKVGPPVPAPQMLPDVERRPQPGA